MSDSTTLELSIKRFKVLGHRIIVDSLAHLFINRRPMQTTMHTTQTMNNSTHRFYLCVANAAPSAQLKVETVLRACAIEACWGFSLVYTDTHYQISKPKLAQMARAQNGYFWYHGFAYTRKFIVQGLAMVSGRQCQNGCKDRVISRCLPCNTVCRSA